MVMLFPDTADRSWPYATTNGQYGQFYGTVIREVQRDDYDYGRHYDCNKQAARMSKELQEAKACLEMVDYTWATPDQGQFAPRGACCLEERTPHSRCKCSHRTTGCYENPYKLGSEVVEWNCGQSREPEFLEDHVRCYHPRLAPKLQVLPKRCTGQTNRRELQGGSVDVRPVGSGGAFGVGLQAGLQGSGKREKLRSRPANPVRGGSAGPPPLPILPASHRYGYYRYYGAAGQGAKTSGDYRNGP